MKIPPKHSRKKSTKTWEEIGGAGKKSGEGTRKKARSLLKFTGDKITSAPKTAWDARKIVVAWGNRQISGGYTSLSKAIRSSRAMSKSTGKAMLQYISATNESAEKSGKRIINHTAVFTNAILASDFSKNMESWLVHMFNEGVPSIYDKAVDAVYIATHIGGGHLHRLFDGSHSLWGM